MRKLVLFMVAASSSYAAGPLIIGVRGGVPLTDIINTVNNGGGLDAATDRYLVGPTLGVKLPLGFSIEGDALFSRLKLDFDSPGPGQRSFNARADSWEFPVMLKFTAGDAAVAPFIGAGASVRHLRDFRDIGDFVVGDEDDVIRRNNVGFVVGGGLRFKAGPLNISPEIRYTRWGLDNIREGFRTILETNKNQAQVLVGLTF